MIGGGAWPIARVLLVALLGGLLGGHSAHAVDVDIGGFARVVGMTYRQKAPIFGDLSAHVGSGQHRLMTTIGADSATFDAHLVVSAQAISSDDTAIVWARDPRVGPMHLLRWPGLEWHEEKRADASVLTAANFDRLVLAGNQGPLDWAVGRQPVNFATTLLFSPHDVFAPFGPTDFFRAYKPGVDALKLAWHLSNNKDVSLVAAPGFAVAGFPDVGDWQARASALVGRADWYADVGSFAVLGGRAPGRWFAGLAAQVDLLGTMFRTEQMLQQSDSDVGFSGYLGSLGAQRSLSPDVSVVAEAFVRMRDGGLAGPIDPLAVLLADPLADLRDVWGSAADAQCAASVAWQVHPLVSLQGLLMASRPQLVGVDASVALANYTTWNFSDEGVAAVGFFANLRGDPAWSANAEVRWTW